MTGAPAKRKDMRGAATRAALIEQAETLFAERGVDGVSLREIGSAIGAGNTNVVLYHFGGKEALIEETIRHRLPDIDRRRADLLAESDANGLVIGLDQALDILFRPLFEQTNSVGRHSYVAFLHSLHRDNSLGYRVCLAPDYPATVRLVALLHRASGLPLDLFERRIQILLAMIAAILRLIDQGAITPAECETAFDDTLAMAKAALTTNPIV